ncbi:Putative Holliday junction resolvase [Gemmata sp. SH-PL17]|uniref:Holliday junction resolvase RuvX n=1 Tax=Gemmata sp. SH-PL17 TaxID=1630693 RepID=UPI00078CCBD6|nr:Holliday junction resolvase RuvX [Gemmata sp. SH-PL17]AMV25674.1 Putative Holliday junction resolvase [Gemmata sp. SH-PL17]
MSAVEPNPLTPFPKKEGGTEPKTEAGALQAPVLSPSPLGGGVGEGFEAQPTPPAPLPEGKGEKEPVAKEVVGSNSVESRASSPFPSGRGAGGVGSRGALLGIDYGTKRIGIAVCDPDRVIASPVGTQANDAGKQAFFTDLVARSKFVGIVVGLPLHASGEESPMSREARAFAQWLADLAKLPFVMWDERFTSSAAEDVLREAKLTQKKRKAKVDRVAAQMILQGYLDAGCPPHGSDSGESGSDPTSFPAPN